MFYNRRHPLNRGTFNPVTDLTEEEAQRLDEQQTRRIEASQRAWREECAARGEDPTACQRRYAN